MFICGSLEKGKDGVGDYTYRLATEITKTNTVSIISIHDKFLLPEQKVITTLDGVNIFRLSAQFQQSERHQLIEKYIKQISPNYISLQFVPFAFHKRGLPISLIILLSRIKKVKWHIMFHELWVGMERKDSLKLKLWGRLQFHIIKTLIKRLKPQTIHSSNPLYIHHLKRLVKNSLVKELPLFGNIEKKLPNENQNILLKKELNIVFFAAIHYGAPAKDFIKWVLNEVSPKELIVKFTFIGKNGSYLQKWITELELQNIPYNIMGIQENDIISKVLTKNNLGISTTPYFLSGKSGSVAAMLEHKLPVLCVSRQWIPKVDIELSLLNPTNITQWNPELKLEDILDKKAKYNTIESVYDQFINDLSLP